MGHILTSTYTQSEETMKTNQTMEHQDTRSAIVDIENMQTKQGAADMPSFDGEKKTSRNVTIMTEDIEMQSTAGSQSHISPRSSNSDGASESPRTMSAASSKSEKSATFNHFYEIIEEIGKGTSSTVYLAREIANPERKVALKIIKEKFLKEQESMKIIVNEINILKNMNHKSINKLISFGTNGELVEKSGKILDHLVYMILEYKPKMLFDVC